MAEENKQELTKYNTDLDNFYKMINTNNVWNLNNKGNNAVKAAMTMLSTKTGMYARIPLYCKGDNCPYAESCQILQYNIQPEGQPCPVEIAQVQQRYFEYAKEFGLEGEDVSFTDRNLVSELITLEIYMERCKGLMSKEGNPVQQILAGVADNGDEIYQPAVSKAWEAYEKLSKKRNENYRLLMSTRQDKKKDKEDVIEEDVFKIIADAESDPTFYDIKLDGPEEDKEKDKK